MRMKRKMRGMKGRRRVPIDTIEEIEWVLILRDLDQGLSWILIGDALHCWFR